MRCLPVGATQNNEPMQWLQTHSLSDKFVRQVIEQVGMARGTAMDAKVICGLNQAAPEVILPDAIDEHASRQWVSRVR